MLREIVIDVNALLAPYVAASLVGAIATFLLRNVARRRGVLSPPKADRWHPRATPLLGGIALWLVTIATTGALLPMEAWPRLLPILCAATGAFALGLIDDFVPVKPATKLTGQIAVGCFTIVAGWSVGAVSSPAIDALISLAWFLVIVNAFNLLDNMDGLCAGVAAIAAVGTCISVNDPNAWEFVFSAALAGACLGFLVFNYHPASIFMGDSGSLFVGGSLAVLTSVPVAGHPSGPLAAMTVPVLLLLIPIFDTLFVTLSRHLALRSASIGGRDHTSHRLVALGFSERQAVLLLWVLAAVSGGAAVALERAHVREANLIVGLLVIGLALLATQLAKVRVYDGSDFAMLRDKAFTPLLVEFTYKRRVFEVLLDLGLVIVAYYGSYVIRFDRDLPQYYDLFVTSLPIVIACQLLSFFAVGVYRGLWRFLSAGDLLTYFKGVTLGTVCSVIMLVYLYRFSGYSRSVFIIYAMALLLLLAGSRYSFRVIGEMAGRRRPGTQRVAIYGAGEGGALLVRELWRNPRYDYRIIGFFDDDLSKAGKRLDGLPVFGGIDRLPAMVVECAIDLVIVSTRKLEVARLDELRRICFESGTGVLQFDFELRPLAGMGRPEAT
jgi:UDP-GlcNAc:undecaprenyl-phosphate/decaprenyl-phosphate GlcNAc-1-phosphate transferase